MSWALRIPSPPPARQRRASGSYRVVDPAAAERARARRRVRLAAAETEHAPVVVIEEER